MCDGVPSTEPTRVSDTSAPLSCAGASSSAMRRSFARPQSITTVSPNGPISTFDGLRSRWTIRSLCA